MLKHVGLQVSDFLTMQVSMKMEMQSLLYTLNRIY